MARLGHLDGYPTSQKDVVQFYATDRPHSDSRILFYHSSGASSNNHLRADAFHFISDAGSQTRLGAEEKRCAQVSLRLAGDWLATPGHRPGWGAKEKGCAQASLRLAGFKVSRLPSPAQTR